jgi:endonuclease/exonuclease/phosphatase family metal-dependent hydrolase
MNLEKTLILFLALLLLFGCRSRDEAKQQVGQTAPGEAPAPQAADGSVAIGFYNVENLFDADHDPGKEDDEFLPGGRYGWSEATYRQKLQNMARAIESMVPGGPAVLGLAEVENRRVLEDLIAQPGLLGRGYRIVHEESPDPRGIDVALIYDPAVFTYRRHEARLIDFPLEPEYVSRQVLMVKGEIKGSALALLVNHWPSRYGGAKESEPRRLAAARTARTLVEEAWQRDPQLGVLVMGDFNDDPTDRSVVEVMRAETVAKAVEEGEFFNPMYALHDPECCGTLTYRGKWNLFDQILVSQQLLDRKGKLRYQPGSATIHNAEFMQVGGDGNAKDMPRRAIYRGEFQERGFSDHFPVYLRLEVK